MAFDNNSYQAEYKRQNYDTIRALVPKGKSKVIKDYATTQGVSVSQLSRYSARDWVARGLFLYLVATMYRL